MGERFDDQMVVVKVKALCRQSPVSLVVDGYAVGANQGRYKIEMKIWVEV